MTLHIKSKNYHTKQCNAPIDYSTNQQTKNQSYLITIALVLIDPDMEFNSCWHFSKWLFKSLICQNPLPNSTVNSLKKTLQDNNFNDKRKKPQLNNTNDSDCWSLVPFSMVSANFSTNCIIKSITSKNQQHFILISLCVCMHLCL